MQCSNAKSVTYFYFPKSKQISEAQWLRAGEMPNRDHYWGSLTSVELGVDVGTEN